jgi:hypothetical protein
MSRAAATDRALRLSERDWQQRVVDFAHWHRWLSYHTFDSRRSDSGFPDLVLIRAGRVVFAELKAESGRVTAAQRRWLLTLASSPGVEVYLWRPSDWPNVQQVLGVSARVAR